MSLIQTFARITQGYIEQRRSIRERVYFPAWIAISDGSHLCDCSFLDFSESGARIEVSANAILPNEFWLVLSKDGTRRRQCQMVWRSGTQVGLEYLGDVQTDVYLSTPN